ncbi:MAG: hypothetical protein SFY81_02115 [Verrucomicrobiota bacterium]|nr:hypothetical protein [Verrucomicrobiota bacterium]
MNMFLLALEQLPALQALNQSGPPTHQLQPLPLADGRFALNPDLLTDCAPGQTWAHYQNLLQTLPIEQIPTQLIPLTQIE